MYLEQAAFVTGEILRDLRTDTRDKPKSGRKGA